MQNQIKLFKRGDKMNYRVNEVAAMIDHTNLKAYATWEDFQ